MPFGTGPILAPVDIERSPEIAIGWATAIARLLNADLDIYFAAPRRKDEPLLREELQALTTYAARRLADRPALKVNHHFEAQWDPGRAIVGEARRVGHQLIVQVTRERGALERLFQGSTTDEVIEAAPCPVLGIPDDLPPPDGVPFKRILAATDLETTTPLAIAKRWSQRCRAGLTFLYVVDAAHAHLPEVAVASDPTSTFDAIVDEARRSVNAYIHSNPDIKPDVTYEVEVRVGDSVQEIRRDVEEGGFDLVMAGHHQRGALARLLLGSIAEEVLHRADVPVLIVPAATTQGEG